jgi:hypothetical protein
MKFPYLIIALFGLVGCDSQQNSQSIQQNDPTYSPTTLPLSINNLTEGLSDGSTVNSGDVVKFQVSGGQFPYTVNFNSQIQSILSYDSLKLPDPTITMSVGNNVLANPYDEVGSITDDNGSSISFSLVVSNEFQVTSIVNEIEPTQSAIVGQVWGGVAPYNASIVSNNSTGSAVVVTIDSTSFGNGNVYFYGGAVGSETLLVTDSIGNNFQWLINISQSQ